MPSLTSLLAVIGPTAAGKTALAIRLARRFGGEVVNADSRQVYCGMDIGTAKPSADEQSAARHHLLDIRAPDRPYSLGEFIPDATAAILDISSRGSLPILCGGTGQYVWALLEGWNVPPMPPDAQFRDALEQRAAQEGVAALWHELNAVAPGRAAAIGATNLRRIIRALELHRMGAAAPNAAAKAAHPPYNALIIGLTAPRALLYQRIDARVDRMMDDGLLDEVRCLVNQGYAVGHGPLSGIGYRQLGDYLAGRCSPDEAVAATKTQTHRLVRRQNTWFKHADARINWLDITEPDYPERATALVSAFLERRPQCDTIAR